METVCKHKGISLMSPVKSILLHFTRANDTCFSYFPTFACFILCGSITKSTGFCNGESHSTLQCFFAGSVSTSPFPLPLLPRIWTSRYESPGFPLGTAGNSNNAKPIPCTNSHPVSPANYSKNPGQSPFFALSIHFGASGEACPETSIM